ncbi:testis-expressed protein 36 isoform X2 [Canis lupus familiaris]|uniref:testis-expressed protein 36 isoform X2 n=1 Tax=Canis lupus familiaris TaxID=9615 RepID=UPI0015F17D23|nr:testis-expressed protein 36 isoform X2 [Canis lupus familiaris]
MAKGRRFNPALDKDGRWFPQIGLTQKTPESSTSAVLKEPHRPHLSRQVEERLPPIYKVREKQAVNNNFPFSVHDNRHSFQSSGCYLDSVTLMAHKGLGRRKISPEKRQHVSRNFNLWAGSASFQTGQYRHESTHHIFSPSFPPLPPAQMGARIRRSVLRLHQGAGLAASLVAATTSCQQNKCNRHPGSCRCSQDYKRP